MRTTGGEKNGLTGGTYGSPAIWIYPKDEHTEVDVEVELTFHGAGFMTSSTPGYNGLWRIHVDPKAPFNKYSSTYIDDPWVPFLDYDGFRDGNFQKEKGWIVPNDVTKLVTWHRGILAEYGLTEAEIDDIDYSYVRMLLARGYKEKFFAVYPQDEEIIDGSVSLKVTPRPESTSRLWLYFVPVHTEPKTLSAPTVHRVKRGGYSVIEVAYLTDREIPAKGAPEVPPQLLHGVVASERPGR